MTSDQPDEAEMMRSIFETDSCEYRITDANNILYNPNDKF
jgi:hypothetical protein